MTAGIVWRNLCQQLRSIFILLHVNFQMLSSTYKSRSIEFNRIFKDIPGSERLIVGKFLFDVCFLISNVFHIERRAC
jgi:hypothetical protein